MNIISFYPVSNNFLKNALFLTIFDFNFIDAFSVELFCDCIRLYPEMKKN